MGSMQISSTSFQNNQRIPPKYTCGGENFNPPLGISEVPEKAQSLVLIVDDPDAPMGTWVHWTVWNIDPKTQEILENSLPAGAIQGKTSAGQNEYHGPCPPSGTHRYFFKIYALDSKLDLASDADKSKLEQAMSGHILDQVELIGLYGQEG